MVSRERPSARSSFWRSRLRGGRGAARSGERPQGATDASAADRVSEAASSCARLHSDWGSPREHKGHTGSSFMLV